MAAMMIKLAERGRHNINFVTPTHVVPQIIEAIKEMHGQVGDLVVNENGVAVRGLVVRHLLMPNRVAGTGEIMKFLAKEISSNTYVKVMDQYRPCGTANEHELISRRLNPQEFKYAVDAAKRAGHTRLDPRDWPRLILRF